MTGCDKHAACRKPFVQTAEDVDDLLSCMVARGELVVEDNKYYVERRKVEPPKHRSTHSRR